MVVPLAWQRGAQRTEMQSLPPAPSVFLLYAQGERPRKPARLCRPLSLNRSPYDAVLLVTGMGHRLLLHMPMPGALPQLVSLVLSEAGAKTSHQKGIGLKGPGSRCCSAVRCRIVGPTQLRGSVAEGCPLPFVGRAEMSARWCRWEASARANSPSHRSSFQA